jgi:hypothetical protein
VAYLVEVPVEGGGRLVVEAEPSGLELAGLELAGLELAGLELAGARPGEIGARARESLGPGR